MTKTLAIENSWLAEFHMSEEGMNMLHEALSGEKGHKALSIVIKMAKED